LNWSFAFRSTGIGELQVVCLYGLLDAADMLILVVIEEETSEVFEVWCSPSNNGDTIEEWGAGTVTRSPELFTLARRN